ncbi:MAG: pseudouridine-5'-phosphate glycosidase [Flavobacteriales bacterium]
MSSLLEFTDEVKEALQQGLPVVALESTIISHGMPYPDNVAMANKVESIVRENGAVPATIAIMNGKIKVGCNARDLEILANSKNVVKVSRRDFPFVIQNKSVGATTVAATMIAASMAGIRVFATGGIGGVHRGWESSLDISADLYELQNTSVAVVSAGAKAILDIPATLEVLESFGVPVIGFNSDTFGAFYSRSSGIALEMNMKTANEIAEFLHLKWWMGLQGGVLISNPIPSEFEISAELIEPVVAAAVDEAKNLGINGKRLTPFLLTKIKEVTAGKSLLANLQLVYNNAALAGQVASAYAQKSA